MSSFFPPKNIYVFSSYLLRVREVMFWKKINKSAKEERFSTHVLKMLKYLRIFG